MIFMGIRELSVALADPYGEDAADFPVNQWMNQLYMRAVYLSEECWSVEEMLADENSDPLPVLKPGESLIDLFVDAEKDGRGKFVLGGSTRQSDSKRRGSAQTSVA